MLGQGAVPLDMLETQVKDWIATEQSIEDYSPLDFIFLALIPLALI